MYHNKAKFKYWVTLSLRGITVKQNTLSVGLICCVLDRYQIEAEFSMYLVTVSLISIIVNKLSQSVGLLSH